MGNIFKIIEVVDLGIEKEKKRKEFYALAAVNFQDKALKELFTKLSNWEDEHIRRFTEIRDSLNDYETMESSKGELNDCISVFLQDTLYQNVNPALFRETIKTPIQAIEMGMEFEKDAILLFNELINRTEPSFTGTIKTLIQEEKQHLVYLNDMRKQLSRK
jgi:rubrerythrin